MWGNDLVMLIVLIYMLVGCVMLVDGGFWLLGYWKFLSGSELCEWVFFGVLVLLVEVG